MDIAICTIKSRCICELNDDTEDYEATFSIEGTSLLLKARHLTKGNCEPCTNLLLLQTLTARETNNLDWTIAQSILTILCHVAIFCMIESFSFYYTFNSKIISFITIAGNLLDARTFRNVDIN